MIKKKKFTWIIFFFTNFHFQKLKWNQKKSIQFNTAHELLYNPHLQSKSSKNVDIEKAISFYKDKSRV